MIKDFRDHPQGRAFYGELVKAMGFADLVDNEEPSEAGLTPEQIAAQRKARVGELIFAHETPVKKLPAISCGAFTEARLNEILQAVGIH